MAKFRDIYSYDNQRFAFLREPMRELIGAWGKAEKWFASLKEWPLVHGIPHLSAGIHWLEHIQPERLDIWATAYRPWLLPLEYPATPELEEKVIDIDRLFEVCIDIIDEVGAALEKMRLTTDAGEFHPLSAATETLQIENCNDKAGLLELWTLWDQMVDAAAFDMAAKEILNQQK